MNGAIAGASRAVVRTIGAACALLLAACGGGGGGGGDAPPAETEVNSVAFSVSAASSSEVGGAVSVQILLSTTQVALAQPLGVEVFDGGAGSATSGLDYVAFAQQTITFDAGAVDGDVKTVTLTPIDDPDVESDETVVIELSSPSVGLRLGAKTSFTLTITDDDTGGPASFVASEGPSGTDNAVPHDTLLDLGTQPVGLGPSAGTLLRVTNAGGAPMELGAPRLTGANPNDFAVEIESAPLGALELLALDPQDVASPLIASSPEAGAPLELDAARLAQLEGRDALIVHDFPAPGFGSLTLALRRRPLPIAADAVLSIDGVAQGGGPAALLGDLSIWSGVALELPESRVFLALSSEGAQGFVELPQPADRFLHIVTERAASAGAPAQVRVVRDQELAAFGVGAPPELCGGALEVPGAEHVLEIAGLPPPTAALTTAECRVAIETDYQLYQKFAGAGALTGYVTQLVAAISEQYLTDVQTTLAIAYLGVYTDPSDPWTAQDSGGTASDVMAEFRAAWAPSSWPAAANLAHFISGAGLGGGVAYVNVLCNQGFGFGVSGNVNGQINWGSWSGAPGAFTWDFVVVAHELGHNFGSQHTHSYCPPLDQCYANCNGSTACSQGTLMSYCHTCGGMDNIDLRFHPVTANIMRGAVNSSCLGLGALAAGDFVQYHVRFNPLTTTGARNANLEFLHDAGNAPSPFRVRLSGLAE